MRMKIRNLKPEIRKDGKSHSSSAIHRSEHGMATILFIALLAIMMILVMVETSSLIRLRREVNLLEHQQAKRLAGTPTNSVSSATIP